MSISNHLNRLAKNDLLTLSGAIFALGPEYRPAVEAGRIDREPVSFIVGEHPSEYSVSPLMWNAEMKLRGAAGLFLPIDIPSAKADDLVALLTVAFIAGAEHFRVLTITNPYKIAALEFFRAQAAASPARVTISPDAERIGATNQILVGPDSVFHVINSDGQGMANAIETYLAESASGPIENRRIGVIGAGGAARGIAYELVKRTAAGEGSVALFNRTAEKAAALAYELTDFFPRATVTAHPLDALPQAASGLDVLVSSITEGDPLFDRGVYATLRPGTLVVDANYGKKSVLAGNAERQVPGNGLIVRDGRGMVVEGYRIPSQMLAGLWKYEVPSSVYREIAALFGYQPRQS